MKHLSIPIALLFVTMLLTACPDVQAPAANVAGRWSGFAGDLSSDTRKTQITLNLEQTGSQLSGTAYFGPPVPGGASGPLTGLIDGNAITFEFSFTASSEGDIATYAFSGEVEGGAMGGNVTGRIEGTTQEVQGEFELERQADPADSSLAN